jgi:eukaryotic-like serine/threonine-protein kinase
LREIIVRKIGLLILSIFFGSILFTTSCLAATVYIPGTDDKGVFFSSTESGIYRFTILDGAFTPGPDDDTYWTHSIHIFNNSPPRWIYYTDPARWGPDDFDYYLGDGVMYGSSTAAATSGVGQFVDIPINAGNYVTMILPGSRDQYSYHRGGITVSISKISPHVVTFDVTPTSGSDHLPGIQNKPPDSTSGDSLSIVMVNEPISRYSTNFINDQPMVGYAGELVKWNGVSWESSPVIESGITDSAGVLQVTFTEIYPGTYYYKFHLPAVVQSWSNIVTVKVLAFPVAEFDAAPKSGPAPLAVRFADTSTGETISSRVWQYKLNSPGSTWTPFSLDGTSSFTFIQAGSYDIKLTVTGTGGSDEELKMNYIHSVPTATQISVPLSVTAVSAPGIQSTPSSLSSSNSGDSNSTLPVDTIFSANSQQTGVSDNGGIVPAITELWRFPTKDSVKSSPAVSNGSVYFGSLDNNLYAIDAVTGKEKWRFVTMGAVYSSPVVSDGIVYFGSLDNNLYAIDAVTGKEKWRYTTWRKVYASPVVANGILYIGSDDGNLYAIDAVTGKNQWQFQTGGYVKFSPAVADGVIYIGSEDNNLYAIDVETGKELWRFATGAYLFKSSPAVSNSVVYFGGGYLYAVYAMTGNEKWRSGVGGGSSPVVSNGVVFGYDNDLHAFDEVTGIEKWRFTMKEGASLSKAVTNGVIYVGSSDKNVYAIDADTGKEKWRFVTGGPVSSSPVVTNGVVYVGSDDGNLYAIGELPTSQANPLKTASTQIVPTNQVAGTNDAPTSKIQNILSSESSSDNGFSTASKQIIGLVTIVFLAGGVYVIYRMKKKPAGYQPPEGREKKVIAPNPLSAGSPTKPELSLTLDRTWLIADDWDRMTIQLQNRWNAPVKDVRLTFSDEFDTKWIKPATINAGATTSLDIGIRPKVKGKIPLEVTALYRDNHDKEFRETHEFWIDVVEKGTTTSQHSETPSSPVRQFTPRPLTPRQLPPDLSDRYTESEFIGKGGFARVFKAKRKDGKYVAVKIPISMDAMTGKSFIAEMQNWTKLSHPNIVRLYDFNIMPLPYFEEELCDSALSDQEKPLKSEEAAWILFNICEGLKFAHAHTIIHRDLKPQNILLKNGVPKISDWGLSRIISESTTTTFTSFTPSYAAPEQINNRVKDERTDIWQLGVILYELVTGVLPFNGDSMVEIGMNIVTKDPKIPGEINPDANVIDAVVMKCLEKDPAQRYQSVLELQKDIAMYLRGSYTELLKMSVTTYDNNRSAFYCGDLVMVNLLTGDMKSANKYLLDLVRYSRGDVKVQAQELSEQLKMRMEMGVTEIPNELLDKAGIIVHQVSVGFRKQEYQE